MALAAAVVSGLLSRVTLDLPSVTTRPSLGLFVVILQGTSVVAVVLGADAYLRRLADHHPWWQRVVATALALAAAAVPLGGLVWWLSADSSDDVLARDAEQSVPVYMKQSSLLGQEHGVLVIGGSVDEGVTYRIRRDDGTTVGEDEILTLADEDAGLTSDVRDLVSAPTPAVVADLGARGVEYVVLSSPADGRISSLLDATAGLEQASAEDRHDPRLARRPAARPGVARRPEPVVAHRAARRAGTGDRGRAGARRTDRPAAPPRGGPR